MTMTKILHFGRSCKAYLRWYGDHSPNVHFCCEECGRRLHKHGRYWRWIATSRELIRIPVYRQFCPECKTAISLLPDFLVPWARYATWIREAAITRRTHGMTWRQTAINTTIPAVRYSKRTLKRWWKRYVTKAEFAAMWIAKELVSSGYNEDLLKMYPEKVTPQPTDTNRWLQKLQTFYCPFNPWRRGYWSFLNVRLPASGWL